MSVRGHTFYAYAVSRSDSLLTFLSRVQKGFPDETPALQPALEKYFAQFGRVNVVRMRRDAATRAFKHSVFIEFAEFAEMEKFVALGKLPDVAPEHPKWEDGTPLVLMTK